MMAAHTNAVENLVIFAPLVFDGAGAKHRHRGDRVRLRALFLVAACARGGLYARHSRAAHAVFCLRLRGTGAAGARDLQTDLIFADQFSEIAFVAQGNKATCSSPVVSGKPSKTFMFCTAWPDAPLVRLSSAETMMARPATRSAATPMKVMLEPRTCRV